MPLPGGPATKYGHRYELWWTVSQLLRILEGTAQRIQLEVPRMDFTEFAVTTEDAVEYHQVRRSHPNGKWSITELGSGVLQPAIARLTTTPTARFVFVSGSDAPELRELSDRARDAADSEIFRSDFLKSAGSDKALASFLHSCPTRDIGGVHEVLRRIQVRTIDERSLAEKCDAQLGFLLSDPSDRAMDYVRRLVTDSVHASWNRSDLLSNLVAAGFALRRSPADAASLIRRATNRYLETIERGLIGRTPVGTPATAQLLTSLREAVGSASVLLSGTAGAGKSATLYECVAALRASSEAWPVLAFRMDHLDPSSSAVGIGDALELGESPAVLLRAAAEGASGVAVLVVDQLDAVSTTSGRRPEFFEAVGHVLKEVRALRDRVHIHVIVACRHFDWENDHRLRTLLPDDRSDVSATGFSAEQVKSLLDASGFLVDEFDTLQITLLQRPLHLALCLQAANPHATPRFRSTKDLLALYWEAKRRAVNARARPVTDHWQPVIDRLCNEMSARQRLSVPQESLDGIPPEYVDQMASEGVLSITESRVGFWHEAFFDYCFARIFVRSKYSLTPFLIEGEQHLFRRAQVRQVLHYLRDSDRSRYCDELSALLTDKRIRWHLKDLAAAVAFDAEDPSPSEWNLFRDQLVSARHLSGADVPRSRGPVETMVWRKFRRSRSWFEMADRQALVSDWLESDDPRSVDAATEYLRFQYLHHGDRVAELLQPFVSCGGHWPARFVEFLEHAELGASRGFFDLILILVTHGALDDAFPYRPEGSHHGWTGTYQLAKSEPEWLPELIGVWLRRLLVRQRGVEEETIWHAHLGGYSDAPRWFRSVAHDHPRTFVANLLSPVLDIADAAETETEGVLEQPLWRYTYSGDDDDDHESVSDGLRASLIVALQELASFPSGPMESILSQLRRRQSYLANDLLLHTFIAGQDAFARIAIEELYEHPWRFLCGPVGAEHGTAAKLVGILARNATSGENAMLEKSILEYSPDSLRSRGGVRRRERARFNLLAGIPAERRSHRAQRLYLEGLRKFGHTDRPMSWPRMMAVESPIPSDAAAKMTDGQWLRAIGRYSGKPGRDGKDRSRGGAHELASVLWNLTKEDPFRFARVILATPSDTNAAYMAGVLRGLNEDAERVAVETRLAVCKKAFAEVRGKCGREIADVLGGLSPTVPDDALAMLCWLATEDGDPDEERWDDRAHSSRSISVDPMHRGLNSNRGRAVRAIARIIQRDRHATDRLRRTIERIVKDSSVAVRAQAGVLPCVLFGHDREWAFSLFETLLGPAGSQSQADRLLGTHYVEQFMWWDLWENFERQRPFIVRALRADHSAVNSIGAELVGGAALLGNDVGDLLEEAYQGRSSRRLGLARLAGDQLGKPEYKAWSERQLMRLFDDPDRKVQRKATLCFGSIQDQDLQSYADLIRAYVRSRAFASDAYWFWETLEKSTARLPDLTQEVVAEWCRRAEENAPHSDRAVFPKADRVARLVLRIYHQRREEDSASAYLDLMDRMCLIEHSFIESALRDYER